jgi:hypothetical protein
MAVIPHEPAQIPDEPTQRLHEDERQTRNMIARLSYLADYGDLDEYMALCTARAPSGARHLDGSWRTGR